MHPFHRSENIKQLYSDAGVKLIYLLPYSPRLHPIKEFFAKLKHYIKNVWPAYIANPDQGFRAFLRKCIHSIGERRESAKGHFQHTVITLQYNRGIYNFSKCKL
jgi:transposase